MCVKLLSTRNYQLLFRPRHRHTDIDMSMVLSRRHGAVHRSSAARPVYSVGHGLNLSEITKRTFVWKKAPFRLIFLEILTPASDMFIVLHAGQSTLFPAGKFFYDFWFRRLPGLIVYRESFHPSILSRSQFFSGICVHFRKLLLGLRRTHCRRVYSNNITRYPVWNRSGYACALDKELISFWIRIGL